VQLVLGRLKTTKVALMVVSNAQTNTLTVQNLQRWNSNVRERKLLLDAVNHAKRLKKKVPIDQIMNLAQIHIVNVDL
jgi:hypothetical protein